MREEAEIASATHEGTLQLIAASGLLPRTASAHEWVRYGLASFFEMPKAPFFGHSTNIVKAAFWPSAGAPHWAWKPYYDELFASKQLGAAPIITLIETLIDQDFYTAHENARRVRERTGRGETLDEQSNLHRPKLARARTLSWALTYFLMEKKLDQYLQFLEAISNLPRDTEIDDSTLLRTFCKCMELGEESYDPNKPLTELDKLNGFAVAWANFMKSIRGRSISMNLDDAPEPAANPGVGPGGFGPAGPGGPNGPGGPGFPKGPGGQGFPMGPGGFPMAPGGLRPPRGPGM